MFTEIIGVISGFMYSKLLIILLLGAGIYFTFRTGFVQFRMFGESVRVVSEKPDKEGSVSWLFGYHANRLTEHAELHKASAEGKINACTQKQDNQQF